MDWTEVYRPKSLKDMVGNGPAMGKLKAWAEEWNRGVPKKRAVILAGMPGTGKTSAALALANDMGWQVIELNASDARNADAIRRIATAGAIHQTFSDDGEFHSAGDEGGRKLIVLDEADNLTERLSGENAAGGGSDLSDKGGKAQMLETIRKTHQPIILIVNDLYALTRGAGSALNSLAETIKFSKVNVRSIPKALAAIAKAEQVRVDPQVFDDIAHKAEGDLRAAVRDLQVLCVGRSEVTVHDLSALGARDTSSNMFDHIRHILKGGEMKRVRRESMDLDATPEDVLLWVEENLPKEYKDPGDLVRGMEMLSRADLFLGRTRRSQNYRLWAYAGDLATLGAMTARQNEYRGYTPYGFPQWLSKMGRTRGMRQSRDAVSLAVGRYTHTGKRKALLHQVPPFRVLFAHDPEFAAHTTEKMELGDDHVAFILGEKATSKAVKEVRAAANELAEKEAARRAADPKPKRRASAGGLAGFDSDDAPAAKPAAKKADASRGKDESPASKEASRASKEDAPSKAEQPEAKPDKPADKPKPEGGQQRLF